MTLDIAHHFSLQPTGIRTDFPKGHTPRNKGWQKKTPVLGVEGMCPYAGAHFEKQHND